MEVAESTPMTSLKCSSHQEVLVAVTLEEVAKVTAMEQGAVTQVVVEATSILIHSNERVGQRSILS